MTPFDETRGTRLQSAPEPTKRRFRVHVGHNHVDVEGHDAREAIQAARSRLSLEMPRLWDVIFHMEDHRFRVEEAA